MDPSDKQQPRKAPPVSGGVPRPAPRPQPPGLPSLPGRPESELRLAQEVARSLRYHHPLSLALLELDVLASPNALGEMDKLTVLSRFVRCVRSVQRDCDVLSRWSETIFVWLLPETELDAAVLACERLRRTCGGIVIGPLPPLTLSMGVAELEMGEEGTALIKRTGYALLASQARGRNCVTRADVLPRKDEL
ncbi:MAG TPA: GGDEF domain-containing protein [Candidatus Saccharimonadales bacterium]|nr:GGDEF domain-containing protein [Candidatus Saccharimonadales bacterium]